MTQHIQTSMPDGTVATYDDEQRTIWYTDPATGEILRSEPYSPEMNQTADRRAQEGALEDNRRTLMTQLATNIAALKSAADVAAEVAQRTNADINANPASAIKDLAVAVRTALRETVRMAKVVTNDVYDTTV